MCYSSEAESPGQQSLLFLQQIRLRGWGSYLLLICILTQIKDCQVSLKLERYLHLSLNFCAYWIILKQKMFSETILYFLWTLTAGVDINSALI